MRASPSLGHQARLQVQCGKPLPFQNIPGGIGSLGCLKCLLPPAAAVLVWIRWVVKECTSRSHSGIPQALVFSPRGSGVPNLECHRFWCSHPGVPQALVFSPHRLWCSVPRALVLLGCCRSPELCEGRESFLRAGMAPVCSHTGGHCLLSTGTTSSSSSSPTPAPNSICSGPGASRPKCQQFQWKWLKWVFKNNNKTKKTHFFFLFVFEADFVFLIA